MRNLSGWSTANRREKFAPRIGFLNRNALTHVPNAQRVLEVYWPCVSLLPTCYSLLKLAMKLLFTESKFTEIKFSKNTYRQFFHFFADMCDLINNRENAQLRGQLLHFCKKLPP